MLLRSFHVDTHKFILTWCCIYEYYNLFISFLEIKWIISNFRYLKKCCNKFLYIYMPLYIYDSVSLAHMCAKSHQSYLTLCNPTDCSPPGSSAYVILQARILEWVAMSSSRGSSWLRVQIRVSCPLHWQSGSLPLAPPRKPFLFVVILKTVAQIKITWSAY